MNSISILGNGGARWLVTSLRKSVVRGARSRSRRFGNGRFAFHKVQRSHPVERRRRSAPYIQTARERLFTIDLLLRGAARKRKRCCCRGGPATATVYFERVVVLKRHTCDVHPFTGCSRRDGGGCRCEFCACERGKEFVHG